MHRFNSYAHRLTEMLLTAFTFTFSPSQAFSFFHRISEFISLIRTNVFFLTQFAKFMLSAFKLTTKSVWCVFHTVFTLIITFHISYSLISNNFSTAFTRLLLSIVLFTSCSQIHSHPEGASCSLTKTIFFSLIFSAQFQNLS